MTAALPRRLARRRGSLSEASSPAALTGATVRGYTCGMVRPARPRSRGVALVATLATAAALLSFSLSRRADAAEELRVGTLAPRASVWGRTLGAWSAAVQQESGGQLKVSLYYGGSQGDEGELATKVKDHTLDGAALGGAGLAAFAPDVAALELPLVFDGWPKLDRARNAVRPLLAESFAKAGVRLLAEAETGVVRVFSRGAPVRTPRDLAALHPFVRSDDVVGRELFAAAGLRPPSLTVAEVFAALLPGSASPDAGVPRRVDVLFASALVVTELRWADLLDHVTPELTAYGIGGIVLSAARFEGLPPEARAILRRTAEGTTALLAQRVRSADARALATLRGERKVVDLTPAERAEWDTLARASRTRLRAGTVRPEVIDRVLAAAGP